MSTNPDWPHQPAAYQKTLAIFVPYRDRAVHLAAFLPHIQAYFTRDKLDRHLRYSVHTVEQLGSDRFDRGRLNNVGFRERVNGSATTTGDERA